MTISIFEDYESLSRRAAEEMVHTVESRPGAVICLASGHSPQKTCEIFVSLVREKKLDLSTVQFIGLDEWVGIPADDPGSCQYFFRHYLFDPLRISKSNYHVFDVSSGDLAAECLKMDKVIADLGGIDLMIVGIGMNGHIGFNEPGVSFKLKCHVAQLHNTTKEVGQKYFSESKVLNEGITLGLSYLTQAAKVLLLANGAKKAEIVAEALAGPVSSSIPASIVQACEQCFIFLDKEAATELPDQLPRNRH